MIRKILVSALVLSSTTAFAHITIASGPAQAGKSTKIALAINHGCKNVAADTVDATDVDDTEDTVSIAVDIPVGADANNSFSGIRPLRSDFGKFALTKNGSGAVTRITWTKPNTLETEYDDDDAYYEIVFKATTPSAKAFTKIPLVITQVCRKSAANGGGLRTVVWAIGDAEEPAPNLVLTPQRSATPGWNKFTIPAGVTIPVADFGAYFGEAQIVWKGTQAFSANPQTKTQIMGTAGVTLLETDLVAGDEVWAH